MVFNNILLFSINIASLIFIYVFTAYNSKGKFFDMNKKIHFFVLLFFLGSIISISNINIQGDEALSRSLLVIPNYLFWCILVIYLSNNIQSINILYISKFMLVGVIFTILIHDLSIDFSLMKANTPNSYAFVLVCFSCVAVVYISEKYKKIYAIIFLFIILLSMLTLERRAGFILVMLSSFFGLFVEKLKFKQLFSFSIITIFSLLVFQLDFVKNALNSASPRIYELIYENEDITSLDDSYLVRRAQVEKGLIMFAENPLTGVGLNNFSKYGVDFTGDFAGAELVINKNNLDSKSAHNSYINILAEGGLFLFIPFVIILLYNIYNFIYTFNYRSKIENAFYFSFFSMTIHIYFISEIVNVYAWFLIGIVSGLSLKYNKSISTK